jgi:polyisoprenoid-binding protein YceI
MARTFVCNGFCASTGGEERMVITRCVLLVAVAFAATTATSGAERSATYRVSGEVTVTCPLTVGGRFEARTRNINGELGPVSNQSGIVPGALYIELQTLETGIGLRDRHLRTNYLQIEKGPDFAVAKLEGIHIEKLTGKTAFSADLALHGQRKQISGTAELQWRHDRIRVHAQFPLKISDFQIDSPSYLGIGVRDDIAVDVTLTAVPATTSVVSAASGARDVRE